MKSRLTLKTRALSKLCRSASLNCILNVRTRGWRRVGGGPPGRCALAGYQMCPLQCDFSSGVSLLLFYTLSYGGDTLSSVRGEGKKRLESRMQDSFGYDSEGKRIWQSIEVTWSLPSSADLLELERGGRRGVRAARTPMPQYSAYLLSSDSLDRPWPHRPPTPPRGECSISSVRAAFREGPSQDAPQRGLLPGLPGLQGPQPERRADGAGEGRLAEPRDHEVLPKSSSTPFERRARRLRQRGESQRAGSPSLGGQCEQLVAAPRRRPRQT
jgi:hypothetical protein